MKNNLTSQNVKWEAEIKIEHIILTEECLREAEGQILYHRGM
jgi:hypothetical protein